MPDFIRKACHEQLDRGIEIGPMHPLAADVCHLLCELTGGERAAVCNTGSEAVLGAMRMARTVTGRSPIISFSGSYHGINDEAIIRGKQEQTQLPRRARHHARGRAQHARARLRHPRKVWRSSANAVMRRPPSWWNPFRAGAWNSGRWTSGASADHGRAWHRADLR